MRIALVVVGVLFLGSAVRGEDLRASAHQRFEQGKREFDAGRFRDALSEFQQAYQLAPYPELLYNIARCHEELHHQREALDTYDRYLVVHADDAEARGRADALRAEVAALPPDPLPPVKLPPTATPRTPPAVLVAAEPPGRPAPLYKKWWLWTAVSVVVVAGVGIGLGVGLTRSPSPPSFPPLSAQ